MKLRIAIVGSDSFIAQKFINRFRNDYSFVSFSRLKTFDYEILKEDFFDIESSELVGCDVIINFAAIVHQPKLNDEKIYERVNYKLPLELAIKAKDAGVKHFIQMSTIAVYGNVDKISNSTSTNPVNFYGKYKLKADEKLLKMVEDDFSVCCLRPSMVYGGGKSPGNLLSLINMVKKGFPLPFKNIANSRTFLNVNNLTSILEKIFILKKDGIILVADEEAYSTRFIISKINKLSGLKDKQFSFKIMWYILKTVKPNLYSKLAGDLYVSNTYSYKELSVEKLYGLEDGLKEMV